jgi:hypothetical protein
MTQAHEMTYPEGSKVLLCVPQRRRLSAAAESVEKVELV